MSAVGDKKQWKKFTVLNTILPMKILTEVNTILKKSEADFADGKPYKTLKKEILRIFGPRMETGEPSRGPWLASRASWQDRSLTMSAWKATCLADAAHPRCWPFGKDPSRWQSRRP